MEKRNPSEKIEILLFRCLEGTADEAEYKKAWEWIQLSRDNEVYYNTLRDAWIASDLLKPVDEKQTMVVWSKIEKSVRPYPDTRGKVVNIKVLRWAAVAAIFVGVYILGALSGITISHKNEHTVSTSYTIEAPKGGKSFMTLEDGTKVWLNAGSQLNFSNTFNKNERVTTLQGEAYFEIAPNPDKPFFVEVSGITIQALGTAFNVKAYPEDQIVETTLVEGSVRIETNKHSKTKREPVILEPNQKATFYKSGQLLSIDNSGSTNKDNESDNNNLLSFGEIEIQENVDTEISTSWKDKRWMVQGAYLGDFASNIERRYDVEIIFTDEELKNYKISATLEEETIEQLLDAIQLTVPIDYKIVRNQVYLKTNMLLKKKYDSLIETKVKL